MELRQPDNRLARWIAALLLAFAVAFFAWRTAVRNVAWQWDFAIYSAASRAWGAGENPYNQQLLYHNWQSHGGAMFKDISWLQSIVPPMTLALIWPFAALPRVTSFWLWYSFNCACLLAAILMLIDVAKLRQRPGLAMIFAAWVLLLGSVESGVAAGQPAMPAVACIVAAMFCAFRGRDVLGGVLLGVAAGFKLQLAAPFIAYFLLCQTKARGDDATVAGADFVRDVAIAPAWRPAWRLAASACVMFLIIAAVGIGRLEAAHLSWFGHWISNIQQAASGGGPNDYITANPNRDHLLNLQVPLFAIFHSRPLANIVTALLVAGAAIIYVMQLARRPRQPLLVALAPLAVLTLIPIYHRYYDASLLIIPLALGLTRWRQHWAKLLLVMMIFFLLPVGWAVNLVRYGHVPAHVAASHWWDIAIMSFWPWMLLAMLIVLLCAGWASPTISAERRDEETLGGARPASPTSAER